MKKVKILSISSALCLGTTLFATVSCNKTEENVNAKTVLKASVIDLSNDSAYKDKFATIDGNLGITKDQINTIIQSKKMDLFSNLISNSNLSIKDQLCIPDEGIISVHVELDKYQDEKGQIVETPITFEIKLTGFKKDGLNTYIDYDDSNNKSITLSGQEQTQASEWIKTAEQAKSTLFDAIKSKIKNPKPGTTISKEDIVFGNLQSDNDKGLVYVETTFKNSIWWENGFSKEFKTTINFYGFKTLDSTQPEKNTKAIPNENVLKKEGTNSIYYSYFSEEFKNIKIEPNSQTTVEQYQTQIKKFINDNQMFIHNFEDSNIEIKNIENNTTNAENIKKGFFDFQIVFKKPTSSTSKIGANKNTNIENNTTQPPFNFNLRFLGFKVEQETPKNLEIESSEWFMKNNIIPGENQNKFYYGIKVILKGDFSGVDLQKPISPISAILKYDETSNGTTKNNKINLSLYITEKNNENNKLTLFFAHANWNDKNYPNGGEIFDKSQIILNISGFDSVQGEIPGGIDQFEVKQISTNSAVFDKKTYHFFSIVLNSKLGNLPGMSADRISKDYIIKFQKDNKEVEAKPLILKWVEGKEVTLLAFIDNATDETEFNKYKEETNISIKIPGFKIKNVYFKGNTIVNS